MEQAGAQRERRAEAVAGAGFVVQWPGLVGYFVEVSGLTGIQDQAEGIPLEHGGRVTLKRGRLQPSEAWWGLYQQMEDESGRKVWMSRVTVELRDETGSVVMTWTLEDAFVTKTEGPSLQEDGGSVLVESMELACTGVTCVLEERTA